MLVKKFLKKIIDCEKAFTLVEMMVVLLIIAVLLVVTIPNIAKHNESINDKGCDAYMHLVETQAQAYRIEKNTNPDIDDLVSEKYINSKTCPDGVTELELDFYGHVSKSGGDGNG